MKLNTIKKTLDKVKELPTLPVVANKVNMILSNPQSNASELAGIIEIDQSITAKILKLVNSAYYSLPQRVTNIQQAIGLLGYKNISHIVLTISVFDTLKHTGKSSFNRREFWTHSIATAILTAKIARECMYKLTEDIFTAGLLHDLGKVFMDGFIHEEFSSVINTANDLGISFYDAEQKLFDVDHSMIGEWITRTWKFPLHVVASIKHHHQEFDQRRGFTLSSDISVDFVRLADIFIRKEGYGINGDGKNYKPQISPQLFKRLPISESDLLPLLKQLKTDVKSSETLLRLASEG